MRGARDNNTPNNKDKEPLRGATTEDSARDRSPIRSDSSPQIIEVNPSSSADTNKQESTVLDMRMEAPAKQAAAPKDDDIYIVAEKEGNRPPPGGGRTSATGSDHSIHRINGLVDDRPLSRQSILHRGSPAVNAAMSNGPKAAYGHLPPASLPSSYYSRSHLGALSDPFGRPNPGGMSAHSAYGLDPRMAALQDPRTMSMLSAHGMLGSAVGLNPFDPMAGLSDPFRDYRMDLFRDPLREAHDRELLRLNELDRAKALSSLYPSYYPPTSLPANMHMPMAPYSTASGMPGSLGLPPHLGGLGHPLGAPGGPGAYKDPLRR